MFVREIRKENGSTQVVIVESVRRGSKVTQKTVRNLGTHKDPKQIQLMRKAAEDLIPLIMNELKPVLPIFDPKEVFSVNKKIREPNEDRLFKVDNLEEEKRFSHGVSDVFGALLSEFKLSEAKVDDERVKEIERVNENRNRILNQLILERVRDPASKRRTVLNISEQSGDSIPLHQIYRMMDWLFKREEAIKKSVLNSTLDLLNQKMDILLFDVTTLYFESFEEDDLRQFGFSKDCKFKETQVVLALVTTKEGLPVTYELFPGKTSEGKTLIQMMESLKKKFSIDNLSIVADRAMFSDANLGYLESLGANYIVAARLKTLNKEFKTSVLDGINQLRFNENSNDWYKEIEHKERRVIVTYSEKRAEKDKKDRDRLVARLEKTIKTDSKKIKLSEIVNNKGTKKYLKIEQAGSASINQEKIEHDAKWDGIHGVITNKRNASVEEILNGYKSLWKIEEAFRINKTDLKMRPIFHWKPKRIRAHILICFLAYALSVQLRFRLKSKKINLSFIQIRDELKKVQTSIIRNKKTKIRFSMPAKPTELQKEIYKAVGLELVEKIVILERM